MVKKELKQKKNSDFHFGAVDHPNGPYLSLRLVILMGRLFDS